MRQLAPFPDGHEAGGDLMRHRAAENEAARLDAGDLVDLVARPWMLQFIDRAAEGARVAEQRGDVAKQDSRLRIVWNGADAGLQIIFKSHRCLFLSFRHCEEHLRRSNPALPAACGLLRCARNDVSPQLTGTPSRNAFSTMRRPISPPSDISDSG